MGIKTEGSGEGSGVRDECAEACEDTDVGFCMENCAGCDETEEGCSDDCMEECGECHMCHVFMDHHEETCGDACADTDMDYCMDNCMCEEDEECPEDCDDRCDDDCGECTFELLVGMTCGDVCCDDEGECCDE